MYKNLSLAVITAVMLFSGGSTWAVGLANEAVCPTATTPTVSPPPACADPIQMDSGRKVINVPTDGVIYGTHLCGASCSGLVLPSSPLDPYAVVSYEIIGEIADEVYVRAELENAKFANAETDTMLVYKNSATNTGTIVVENSGGTPQKCESNGGECRWILRPQTGSKLQHGDKIYIYYRLTNLVGFDTDGTQVKMTVKLGEQFNPNLMGQDSIVVANAKTPLEAGFEAGTDPSIKISSEDEFKNFTSTTSGGSDELIDATRAVMGYLILKRIDDVMAEDGMTPWYLGETNPPIPPATAGGGADAAVEGLLAGYDIDNQIETMLTITNGQFAASKTDSSGGEVYLEITYPTTINISAEDVTDTDATWHLSDGELSAIVRASDDPSGQNKIPIVIKVDGDNPILTDTGEDALPEATLVIDYVKAESQKDVTIGPTALRRFTADGISCWVYSVPNADAKDVFNLRITNDSTVDGVVRGSLYGLDGGSIFSKQSLLGVDANGDEIELKAGATVRLTAPDLAALPGGPYSWSGRGIMNITSTLSRLEVLVLLREKTGGPLTNMSVGAHGVACEN